MAVRTSLRINIPKGLKADVSALIEREIQDDSLLKEIGESARRDAIVNILSAKEPASGQSFAVPTITDGWRRRKQQLSRTNNPIDGKAGGRSSLARLAFTGQFLESFRVSIERVRGIKTILVGPEGQRSPYKNLDGSPGSSRAPTNEELGAYLIEQGRDWTGIPRATIRSIVQRVRARLRRRFRR